jgi:hypothetical protein
MAGGEVTRDNAALHHAHLIKVLNIDSDTVLVVNFPDGTNVKFDKDGAITDDCMQTKYPSLWSMAKNLLGAAGRAVKNAAEIKAITVPDEVKESRLEQCRSCDKWNADDKRCSECGCSTSVKLALAPESCPHPDGPKWGAYSP